MQATRNPRRQRSSFLATALLAASAVACSQGSGLPEDDDESGGSSSARGGASSTGGAGGSGGGAVLGPDRTCDASASEMGAVDVPSPLVSVGAEVFASSGVTNPDRLVDGLYRNFSTAATNLGIPSEEETPWVAIRIEPGPTRLLAMWSDAGFSDYRKTDGGAPIAYTIEVSADSEDGEDGSWTEVASVTENPVRARAHSFDFADQAWVRLSVLEGPLGSDGMPRSVNLDEIALFDLSASEGERPTDSWFFLGDSITKGAFQRDPGVPQFDALINAMRPDFTPIQLGGGFGGELLTDGLRHIEEYLELNPDFEHVLIGYGTNDSWSNKSPGNFEENLRTIVETVLDAGRVPVLPTIPYAVTAHDTLPAWNAIVDEITAEFALPCGPDLYAWFRDHPEELNETDGGIHPIGAGYRSMNELWTQSMLPLYPAAE